MILHSEVNQEGILQAYLPQFKGKKVIVSVESTDVIKTKSNWEQISSALQQIDVLPIQQRNIEQILNDLRSFRETQ
jgi:hypothetical protein